MACSGIQQGSAEIGRRSALAGFGAFLTLVAAKHRAGAQPAASPGPLPSWNDGAAKQAVLEFIRATTDPSSKDFVAPDDRIATFDQDGTLWVEHPIYAQAAFAIDRVRQLAPQHPEWQTQEPFKTVFSDDPAALGQLTEKDWAEIVFLTHAGMSQESFKEIVSVWLKTAQHPRYKRLYTELVYQPMREVMDLLRNNAFQVYIVTGGGQDFVRAYSEQTYGLQPERIIGSALVTQYEVKNGKPEIMRLPKLLLNDDGPGKAIDIDLFIGKRPYAAFGNSTGDRQMLEWTGAGSGAPLNMLVRHDDAVREYAYGPETKIGTFDQSLEDQANARSWTIISMKDDWRRIFPFE